MRSDTAAPRRVRPVSILAVAGAVAAVMLGGTTVAAATVMHLAGSHLTAHHRGLGLALGVAAIAVGITALLVIRSSRAGRSARGRRRRPAGEAGHRDADRRGPGQSARAAGASTHRRPVLNPTTVYSPGGLVDIPRDARAPAAAGPPPPLQHQPGVHPAGPGWGQPGRAGRQPPPRVPSVPPVPPRDRMAPPGAGQPRQATPGAAAPRRAARYGATPHGPGPYGTAPHGPGPYGAPSRQAGWPREPPRPDGPLPPRESFRPGQAGPAGPGPGGTPGRAPGGPGYAAPGGPGYDAPGGPGYDAPVGPGYDAPGGPGYATPDGPGHAVPGGPRHGAPGSPGNQAPGTQAPPAPRGTFDGGYAAVIPASDYPVRPAGRGRPANAARPAGPPRDSAPVADAGVFVYRDTSAPPAGSAAKPRSRGPDDASYWYDLLAEDPVPRDEEVRGPFEPLVPSAGPPSTTGGRGLQDAAEPDPAGPEDTQHARARKLEQIKDLYLTAQAIGEQNVDKHFDQLLAQQRQLISEYFGHSAAVRPTVAGPRDGLSAEAEAGPEADTLPPYGEVGPPPGAGLAAEHPRAW